MNVSRICDLMRPVVTDEELTVRYKAVRPARKLEADLQDLEAELPLCLVHPWREDVRPNRYDNFVKQRADQQFAVVTVCAIEQLEALRNLLDTALIGKVLQSYHHEIVAVSGEVLNIEATVIWWRDIYQTATERSQSS